MNEYIKIKLAIADRVYPLTIAPEQEASLRVSAKKIEGVLKQLEKSYAVRDKQDVLAMCTLQFAAQLEKQSEHSNSSIEEVDNSKIQELIEMIDAHLQL